MVASHAAAEPCNMHSRRVQLTIFFSMSHAVCNPVRMWCQCDMCISLEFLHEGAMQLHEGTILGLRVPNTFCDQKGEIQRVNDCALSVSE